MDNFSENPIKDDVSKSYPQNNIKYYRNQRAKVEIQKHVLLEQLHFAKAENRLTETIIQTDSIQLIIEEMARVLGETLKLDNIFIFEINKENLHSEQKTQWYINKNSIEKNQEYHFEITLLVDILNKNLHKFESHIDKVNPLFEHNVQEFFHEKIGIKSLLCYPFAVRADIYYILVCTQMSHRRVWRKIEMEFLRVIATQVENAFKKFTHIEEKNKNDKLLKEQVNALQASIDSQKKIVEKMIHEVNHDSLTGLPNRSFFNESLKRAIIEAKDNNAMLAIMFLDLDRFKLVNDTMGHAIGDLLLKGVADRLFKCLRKDDIISRLGGDEFTLLIPRIHSSDVPTRIATDILKAFQKPWNLFDNEFYVTTSIGIALYPNDGETAEELMKNADTAMYRAKEKGNNYQYFTRSMKEKIVSELSLENSLRHALQNNEFVIHYQPQVNIHTRQVIGNEALLRWNHPELGIIPPVDFIPIAEESDLIISIGEWVLKHACIQNKAWQDKGLNPMKISVNLSLRQLQHKGLVSKITTILKETGMDPQWLVIEVSESVAMKDIDFTISVFEELRQMGIQIAIDDFGTGYSVLNYLRKLPISTLKIDRTFISEMTNNTNDAAIVSAVIDLAKGLNLKVVAEGVETEDQLSFLKDRKCNKMQGFLLSKPIPVEEYEGFLKSFNSEIST